ncbi:MAG: hypothetical protein HY593_05790 [Candidatus Omnitrophica bacterium]|nr:hypothetical protein [Candidatus Omnitrophota bacterium]
MADEAQKTGGQAQEKPKRVKKKKSWPTNCAQSNKRIRRRSWYYRNGMYFANKKCFKLYQKQKEEEKAKEAQKEGVEAKAA